MLRRRKSTIEKEAIVAEAQLELLRAQEVELQRILDEIQRRKDAVSAQRQRLEAKQRDLDSERQPINWLPPELLIKIFLALAEADLDCHDPTEAYHRPPVVISHVCSRWRNVSLGVSKLWARISVQSLTWHAGAVVEFLKRSVAAPVDVIFIPPTSMDSSEEFRRADGLFDLISPHIGRVRSIAVYARGAAMQKLVVSLSLPTNVFSSLRSLNLSLVSMRLSTPSLPSLIPFSFRGSGAHLKLKHLRLDKLPLFNIPKNYLPNLLTLELSFPPKKINSEGPDAYLLRMSHVVRFLNAAPELQELVLLNTVPYMDVCLSTEDNVQYLELELVNPVELVHLRSLDWTYPYGPDVHYFLSFFVLPALEHIDVGVDEFPQHRPNVLLLRGYSDTVASNLSHRIINLTALRSLNVQCAHSDTFRSVMRKFALPALETLDLAYVGRDTERAPLPRLESLFHDPRLPTLTHLALTCFALPADGVAPLLGYLPALAALTLVACDGASALLAELQQRTPDSSAGVGSVRACPRLAALTLQCCDDVDVSAVVGVVLARNAGARAGVQAHVAADGTGGGGGGGHPAVRAIRPTKRLRVSGATSALQESADIASRMVSLALQETRQPVHIRSVHIEACPGINEAQAMSLRSLGVANVVWRGDGVDEDEKLAL
ncbi:hypothetical protein GGX14DRAFT_463883 [Mycena pura]|uniref:F-box domain-containing protein n=1 Tax=Mycena pura TaxID=153505 RepID=A0AAD6V412_9AGAR|nr:hypothetical protein GGX14DRAFT_463883 [Mycena pura]